MLRRTVSAIFAALALSASGSAQQSQPAQPPALEWHRSQLPCGVRVIIVRAPQAKKQTTFTFLPVNLANDDVDRAQWSHLLEHMLIRTTDAEGLNSDGVTFNGETTDSYLRLETFAEPAHWKDALDRHARWLTATAFDAQRLEREKGMIAGEEQSTAANGMTGKFALAAWNQIFTFDRDRANVHGDVQRATIENVATYAKSRVVLDSDVLIATIGPTPVEDALAEITRLLGDVKPPSRGEPDHAPAAPPTPANQPAMQQAKWDLPTRHVLWCWPLPDHRPQTLAAATGVSRGLMMRVRSRRDVGRMIRSMSAHPAITTQRGTYMLLDACIADDAKPEDLCKAVRECAAALCDRNAPSSMQSIVFAARLAAQEMSIDPNFEQMAQQTPAPMRDAVEGLWLLSQLNYEYVWRVPATDVQPLLMNLDEQAVAEVLSRMRSAPATFVLEPDAAVAPN